MILLLAFIIILMLGVSGVLAATETAITASSPGKIQKLKTNLTVGKQPKLGKSKTDTRNKSPKTSVETSPLPRSTSLNLSLRDPRQP